MFLFAYRIAVGKTKVFTPCFEHLVIKTTITNSRALLILGSS